MKFRVTHKTQYIYAESVPASHSVAHLRPRNTDLQTCIQSDLAIHPKPAHRRDRVDFFGNNATWFTIDELHRKLTIEADSHNETRWDHIPIAAGTDGDESDSNPSPSSRKFSFILEKFRLALDEALQRPHNNP